MQEAVTSATETSNVGAQVSEEDTDCAVFVTEGTRTDIGSHEVLHDSKSVHKQLHLRLGMLVFRQKITIFF